MLRVTSSTCITRSAVWLQVATGLLAGAGAITLFGASFLLSLLQGEN